MPGTPEHFELPTSVSNLLRLEGAAVLAGSVWLFAGTGHDWIIFLLLFLAPDLAMIGYRANPGLGATTYNLVHCYALPAALGALGWVTGTDTAFAIALIWTAHIGLDRMLGFGLKLPTDFKDTHMGRIGGS